MIKNFIFFLIVGIFSINLVSAYNHCITLSCGTDCIYDWCCDDEGYVICDESNPDVCGPDGAWCDSYLNGDKSCYLDSCCSNSGIIDYGCVDAGITTSCCCPATSPFRNAVYTGCFSIPTAESNNWYTRQSTCKGFEMITGGIALFNNGIFSSNAMAPYESALSIITIDNPMNYLYCNGFDLMACKDDISPTVTNLYSGGIIVNSGIFHYINKGPVVGRCGVECSDEGCNGLNSTTCVNYKNLDAGYIVGKCGVECTQDSCQGTDLILCQNYKNSNQGKAIGFCGVECTQDSCTGKDYIQCINYININKGPAVGRCGVECISGSKGAGYTCIRNTWIKDSEITSQSYLSTTASNYYRFNKQTDACTLMKLHPIELTDYDYKNMTNCESNVKTNFSRYTKTNISIYENKTITEKQTPTPFDWSKLRGILLIGVVIVLIIVLYLRGKKK